VQEQQPQVRARLRAVDGAEEAVRAGRHPRGLQHRLARAAGLGQALVL